MRFSPFRLATFGFAGLSAMLFLAWFDAPGRAVDRHTGQRLDRFGDPIQTRSIRTPEEILAEARARCDARLALETLHDARAELGSTGRFVAIRRALEAELLSTDEFIPLLERTQPDVAATLRGEIESARAALGALLGTDAPADEVIALLRAAEDQVEVSTRVEQFFAPMAGGRHPTTAELHEQVTSWAAADLIAALAMSAAGGTADAVPANDALVVARAFRAAGRRRGTLRWVLRAWERAPSDAAATEALVTACLGFALTTEAHIVLAAAHAGGLDTPESWDRQAQLAAWLGRPDLEVGALSESLRHGEDVNARRRLMEIQEYVGDASGAYAQAVAIARLTNAADDHARAAQMALEDAQVDDAVAHLGRAAAADPGERAWHERVVSTLLQDLRADDAIHYLAALHERDPGGGWEPELERLLRRRNRLDGLAELLEARLARQSDPAVARELTGILLTLGRVERVRELQQANMTSLQDPVEFFRHVALFRQLGLTGVPEKALDMALAPQLETDEAAFQQALGVLQGLAGEPSFEAAVVAFADRFSAHVDARALTTVVVDATSDNPVAVAEAAEQLWLARPERDDLLVAWIERAGWAGMLEAEIRAREARTTRHPDDIENLRRLGDLQEAARRLDAALATWRAVQAQEGRGGEAEERVLLVLLALGDEEGALALLAGRADRGGLPLEERLALAERFFGAQWVDRALQLFLSVLAEDPDHQFALKRVAQTRAWGNDPSGSIPYFERLLELAGDGDGEVPFLLGEAYWATRRDDDGRTLHERALPLLRETGTLTPQRESMVAKALARLGKADESKAVYERLLAADPDNQDLAMDFADAMLSVRRYEEARQALELARPLAPDHRRFLRLDGQVRIEERRYDDAVAALQRGLDIYGPDAGFHSDLGRALEPLGRWREAHDAYDAAVRLQPDNEDVTFLRRVMADRLSHPSLEAAIRSVTVGEDATYGLLLEGSLLLDGDRWRLSAALDHAQYSGRANAFHRARKDVEADVETLSLALSRRFDAQWEAGGGLDFYAGRDDADAGGFWLGVGRRLRDPYRSFAVRFHMNEVLAEPAGAVGLGGASDGLRVDLFRESRDQWWWISGGAEIERLTIEHPRRGRLSDLRARGELVVGRWLRRNGPDITERLHVRRTPATSEGTTARGEPAEDEGPRVAAWVALQPVRLLDGQDLAGPIPLGKDFDYLTASLRAVDHAAAGFTWDVEGYAGTDLREGGLYGGVRLGIAWRPEEETEIRLGLSHGRALGRSDDDDGATALELAVTLRW